MKMITGFGFFREIKFGLSLCVTLFVFLNGYSQINDDGNIFKSEAFSKNPKDFINSKLANDLIHKGNRFQIYYGLFRLGYSSCVASSASVFNFEPVFMNHACIVDRQLADSIEVFNSIMARRISIIEGHGWQKIITKESEKCVQNVCGTNGNVENYVVFGLNNSLIGYKYNLDQYNLNPIRSCLIDESLGVFLVEYPKSRILLRGYSITNEDSKLLAQKRVDQIIEYLSTKGIESSRISIEIVKVEDNIIKNETGFDANRVDFSIISID